MCVLCGNVWIEWEFIMCVYMCVYVCLESVSAFLQ